MPAAKKLLWGLLLLVLAQSTLAEPLRLTQAFATIVDSESQNEEVAVTLPHQWNGFIDGYYGEVHYRIPFELGNFTGAQWCLLIPRLNMNAQVKLNGYQIGDGGRFEEPLARNWQRPLNFCFPTPLLHVGKNEITVELKAVANKFGQLSYLLLGQKQQIVPIYQQHYFSDQTIHQLTTFLSFALALIIGFLWTQRRQQTAWLWFALSALVWGFSGLNIIISEIPMATRYWEWLAQSSISLVPLFVMFFLHRLQNRKPVLLERTITGLMLLGLVSMLLCPLPYFFVIADIVHGLAVLIGIYTVLMISRHYVKTRSPEFLIILLSFGLILIFALHDLMVQVNFFPPGSTFLMNFSVPAFLLIISIILINQFVRAIRQSEELNLTLESRIVKAEAEIKNTYKQLMQLEMESAVGEERKRIMRDLHDDLGGKLLTMVYSAKDSKLQSLARSTLEDMRELVRAGQEQLVPIEFEVFCSNRQEEIEEQLNQADIELIWCEETEQARAISGQTALHLKRILNEAVVNAIKHADASSVEVKLNGSADHLSFVISDNGRHFNLDSIQNTNGINNMNRRALRLGASIQWHKNSTGGCRVELNWNLEKSKKVI